MKFILQLHVCAKEGVESNVLLGELWKYSYTRGEPLGGVYVTIHDDL